MAQWNAAPAWGWNNAWQSGGRDPFRLPNQTSGMFGPGDYQRTPLGQEQLEDERNRLAAFTYYNQGLGVDPTTSWGKFLDNQYSQISTGYEAGLSEDPTLTFQSYYRMIYPQLQTMYDQLTPDQRGENVGRFAKPVRVVPRGG